MEGIPLDKPSPTGSRLGLTIQEIPSSIEVVSSQTMTERGYNTTLQALESAVGVASGNCFGLVCFSMRGFANVTSLPFLFNGNRYPGLAIPPRSTFNYEHIEVIKGSSSVLHGLGSTIGAVNYITKKADDVENIELEASYGSWNKRRIGLGAGGKLGDHIDYRLDGHYAAADNGSYGFVDRTRYEDFHVSGEVAMDVTNDLRASISIDAFRDRGEGYFGTPLVNGKIDKRVIRQNYNVHDDRIEKNALWTRINLDYQLTKGFHLRNELYMNLEKREWKNVEVYKFNNATGLVDRSDFFRTDHHQAIYGNRSELLLEQPLASLDNKMLVGFDVSYNRHQRNSNSPFGGTDSVDFLDPEPGFFNSTDPFIDQRRTKVTNLGLYLEDFLNLTKTVKLALSYRRDISRVRSFDLQNDTDFTTTFHGNSWRIGALYDLIPTLTLYGQWSGAAEPPSQIVTLPARNKDFDLTTSRQWEVGLKGTLFDERLQATLALFDLTRKNILTRDTSDPNTVQQIGQQSSQGIELAVGFRPTWQWAFDANLAFVDAQFDKFADRVSGVGVSRKGNRPRDVPKVLANVWTMFHPTEQWRIGAGIHYVGARWADRANTINMEEYFTVDAVLAYRYASGELSIHGRNLNDQLYANRSYGNSSQVLLGESRAWEVMWRMDL
ncbi:MAG: TonB-dependent receptor [Nitrospirales bacterium]|nr:MAG: TonB-dependent receptor [Nitrospirales bacterium]